VKVAIAGAGNVGQYIAYDLREGGHDVMVIEQDPDLVALLSPRLKVEWFVCDACEPDCLQEAGLDSVDVVVAATGDDEDNLVISLLAKQVFAVPRVVARVNHPNNQWLFNESWGVDVSVSSPHLLTAVVEEAVTVGSLVRLLQFGDDARLVEVTLADDSPAVGPALSELGVPRDATVVAVIRERHLMLPRGETTMLPADEVLVLVTPESEPAVRNLFVGTPASEELVVGVQDSQPPLGPGRDAAAGDDQPAAG
jgi:trk system potassium uptake protein